MDINPEIIPIGLDILGHENEIKVLFTAFMH